MIAFRVDKKTKYWNIFLLFCSVFFFGLICHFVLKVFQKSNVSRFYLLTYLYVHYNQYPVKAC
jgi:hypothetical protein